MYKKLLALILSISLCFLQIPFSNLVFANANTDNLILNKTVTPQADENGNYQISLESFTKGKITSGATPVDVILVLDRSSSMNAYFTTTSSSNYIVKLDGLKTAVNNFLTSLNNNALENSTESNKVVHRVSVITFSNDAEIITGDNFKLLDGTQEKLNDVTDKVTAITGSGGTQPEKGMIKAQEVLEADKEITDDGIADRENRKKVLILFSDGVPASGVGNTSCPDTAIQIATEFKNDPVYKMDIYSVGIFADADPNMLSGAEGGNTDIGQKWHYSTVDSAGTANRFMNYFSSNSPDATDLGIDIINENGSATCVITDNYTWSNKNYYFTSDNANGLNTIFVNLSNQIVVKPNISLDDDSMVCDYLSNYFKFSNDFLAQNTLLEVLPFEGNDSFGEGVTFSYHSTNNGIAEFRSSEKDYSLFVSLDKENKKIKVTGFDYDKNTVAIDENGNPVGNKLKITFDITREDNFIGGNDVPTNLEKSGVYDKDDNIIKKFEVPDTQVDLIYDISPQDQIIYKTNYAEIEKILNIDTTHFGFSNDYVDITYTVLDENDNTIGLVNIPAGTSEINIVDELKMISPSDDTTYKITCKVSPKPSEDESVAEINETENFTLYVLKPDIQTRDLWVDYGTKVNLNEHAIGQINWESATNPPNGTYHSNESFPPKVTVLLKDDTQTEPTIYENWFFEIDSLQITSLNGNESTQTCNKDINVKLNEYWVEITKVISKSDFNQNPQSFIFNINQNGEETEILMPTNAFVEHDSQNMACTVKVTGLYAGLNAKITEDTAWCWRYELLNQDKTNTVFYENEEKISYCKLPLGQTFSCFENKLEIKNWLSDEQSITNKFAERDGIYEIYS